MIVATNIDTGELAKFEALAHQYWDAAGPLHTLHTLNPLRVAFVAARARLAESAGRGGARHVVGWPRDVDGGAGVAGAASADFG